MPDDRRRENVHSETMIKPIPEKDAITISKGQFAIAESIRKQERSFLKMKRNHLIDESDISQKHSLELASGNCSPRWILVLSFQRYNFEVSTSEFRDGIALKFG